MKLYTVPLAPNPTRVTLYLAERRARGADIAVEPVVVNTLKGRHREPEHLARNSFGTLPVLELDSGAYVTESLSIIDYFEAAFPAACLLPSDAEHAAELVARMQPGFDYAETLLGDGRAFLTGSDPSIADCTLAAFLQFMRYTGLDLIAKRAQLCRWDNGYRSRPEVEDCFLM